MRKISYKYIRQLYQALEHIPAAPFPGRWPTRIMISGMDLSTPHETQINFYIGKPSSTQVARYKREYLINRNRRLYIVEFDKKQILYQYFMFLTNAETTGYSTHLDLFRPQVIQTYHICGTWEPTPKPKWKSCKYIIPTLTRWAYVRPTLIPELRRTRVIL